jgi:hypothetical protein
MTYTFETAHHCELKKQVRLTETGCEGVNWIQLPQDTEQWRAFVNTVIKLQVL